MPVSKDLPFAPEVFHEIAELYGTPVYVYNEAGIRANTQAINDAFSWSPDYRNYFAVKATPTPAILRVIHDENMGFDCSSRGELVMVEQEGLTEHGLFYTSNNTPDEDYRLAADSGALINIDKYPYLEQVRRVLGELPAAMAIRYNPGDLAEGNDIIGNPVESKFGATGDQVLQAVRDMRAYGVERIGLHTMIVSNQKNPESFRQTARLLRQLADRAFTEFGLSVSFINVGGGIGVNYHPGEDPVDVEAIGQAVHSQLGDLDIPIFTEHGRYVTGPHGYMLTRVRHSIQETYQPYVEVDTSINNMARLATVSAAYHHIQVLGREGDATRPMNITGSMCANTDKFFRDRELQATIEAGDLMIIQDAGAHMRANSHNYNFQLRAGEVLVHPDGTHTMIRRHETIDDLLATTKGL